MPPKHIACEDCAFAAFPRDWRNHSSKEWVECTFLDRDTRVDSTCQVVRGGLRRLLKERPEQVARRDALVSQLSEYLDGNDWEERDYGYIFDLERAIEQAAPDPDLGRAVRMLWEQASNLDGICPKCGRARLDLELNRSGFPGGSIP